MISQHVWGPYIWKVLFYLCADYYFNTSKGKQEALRVQFDILSALLPCSKCRDSYNDMVDKKKLEWALEKGKKDK